MEKKGKKIVLIGTAHPFRGGLAAYNERLANEFLKDGNEVIIYTFKLQYPGFLFPGKTQYADWPAPDKLDIRVRVNSVNPLNWITVGREINKLNADMLIYCYWMSFFAPCFGTIAFFAKNKRTKHFALIHNMIPHEPTILDKFLPKYFTKSMDGFVAMADSVRLDINKFTKGLRTVKVSPHPIYDHYGECESKKKSAEYLKLDDRYNYLLFFGLVRAYKGLDILLQAFADKRLEKFNLKLIIAGEFYENEKNYFRQIKDLGLEGKIVINNFFIPNNEVKYYFGICDLVVQPYKTATQSGVTQVAYHFNKPMLVTDVGGLGEIVPHNKVGYVVDVDPIEIANALYDFFENKKQKPFNENVKNEKLKYSWNKMTDQFYELLNL